MSASPTGAALFWMRVGTDTFLGRLAGLTDDDFGRGSALEGWTNAHVAAHVAFNAEALQRLLSWARTGVETPMYASAEARGAQIEEGARRRPTQIREHVSASALELARDVEELPEEAWSARVMTAQGRPVPASEVVWMRTREVWVHAVDLRGQGTAVTFDAFPDDLVDALHDDVVAMWRRRGERRALTGLTAWLTGRGGAPDAPRWL